MPFFTFWPDRGDLIQSGYGAVAHVPCIFNISGEYVDEVSRYLRERALCNWSPMMKSFKSAASPRYPTPTSLKGFADALINFLEWTEYRGRDWRSVRYTEDMVNGYQEDMTTGAWSAAGRKLAASTINLRVGEACNYLCWAADKGLRAPFFMVSELVRVISNASRTSNGKIVREMEVRVGRVRPDPQKFELPTDEAVQSWHKAVVIERGVTKALMCELIINSGIRREEAVEWQIDTLPENESDWEIDGDLVTVKIMYGAKGGKTYDKYGEPVGPERHVTIPLSVARKIAGYRMYMRPRMRAKYALSAKTPDEQKRRSLERERRLFLSEETGRRISAQTLYDAWTEPSKQPFAGWSPHMGRHYWACKKLLTLLRQDAKRHGVKDSEPIPGWAMTNAPSYIDLVIRPQLGHLDASTTHDYLTWMQKLLSMSDLQEAYTAELEFNASTLGFEV